MKDILDFAGAVGKIVIRISERVWDVGALFIDTLRWIVRGFSEKRTIEKNSVFGQMVFSGVESFVIVFFVAMFTGIVIAMQTAPQFVRFGGGIYVAGLVAVSLARELGPVFTALVVAGRVGSAITAELGTMKVSEQIEALETIALNPVRFLVVPRFIALFLMLPCLTVIADLAGIIGGFIVGVFSLRMDPQLYIDITFRILKSKDVVTGLVKSLVFAVVIAVIGCYKGLNTSGGAEGVGKSTTQSVVASFILIIIFDCVLTGVFYFSNI